MATNESIALNKSARIRSDTGDARVLINAVENLVADWQDDGIINGNQGSGNIDEIVAMIEGNTELINNLETNKVNVSDIVNDLATKDSSKPLSAEMGAKLKELIDDVGANVGGSSESGITEHNTSPTAHPDIRDIIAALKSKLDDIEDNANNYVLPVATTDVLGGIKQGNGVSITNDGVLSANELQYMSNMDFLNIFN